MLILILLIMLLGIINHNSTYYLMYVKLISTYHFITTGEKIRQILPPNDSGFAFEEVTDSHGKKSRGFYPAQCVSQTRMSVAKDDVRPAKISRPARKQTSSSVNITFHHLYFNKERLLQSEWACSPPVICCCFLTLHIGLVGVSVMDVGVVGSKRDLVIQTIRY